MDEKSQRATRHSSELPIRQMDASAVVGFFSCRSTKAP
jgi:hypothetical protein